MKKNLQNAQTAATNFKMDWCSHQAARYAVENWHYSKVMPAGKAVKIGAWEDGQFVGVIIFSRGANNHIGNPYGMTQFEVCELTRVAMREHKTPISKMLAIAIKMLKKQSPGIKLIVSYADADQEHLGGIYQATNWIFTGLMNEGTTSAFIVKGRKRHPKSIHSLGVVQSLEEVRKHLDPNAQLFKTKGKYKYLFPLTDEVRKQLIPLMKPYPKKEIVAG